MAHRLKPMKGWLGVVTQALLLVILRHWVNHPKRWLSWTRGAIFGVTMLLPLLGLLVRN